MSLPSSTSPLQHLLVVLSDRNIPLTSDDVAWAFSSPQTKSDIEAWVHKYLSPDHLLTEEELKFFNQHGGKIPHFPRDLVSRPLTDADFENAIASLDTSTAALEAQSRLLAAQKEILLQTVTSHRTNTPVTNTTRARAAHLDTCVRELTDTLTSQTHAARTTAEAALAALPSGVERILEKDDRVLSTLQNLLSSRLPPRPTSPDENDDEVETLCSTLTTLTSLSIRRRVDAAFRSHLSSPPAVSNDDKKMMKQYTSLTAELNSLSQEIDALASMAVDAQFRTPITQARRLAREDAARERARWCEWGIVTLKRLVGRLEAVRTYAEELRGWRNAVVGVGEEVEKVVAAAAAAAAVSAPAKSRGTMMMQHDTPKGLKPLRLVQAHSEIDPASQVLRMFGVREEDGGLEQAVREWEAKVMEREEGMGDWVGEVLSGVLEKGDEFVEGLVWGGVFAGGNQWADEVKCFEEKIEKVGARMRGLDVEGIGKEVGRSLREALGRE